MYWKVNGVIIGCVEGEESLVMDEDKEVGVGLKG